MKSRQVASLMYTLYKKGRPGRRLLRKQERSEAHPSRTSGAPYKAAAVTGRDNRGLPVRKWIPRSEDDTGPSEATSGTAPSPVGLSPAS
ncbi:hypothetical protein NDU88_002213 [Pleurodeles waltl]|uniref:Uncharacterized protein n=1 Tax=Pleurodeles waltl TaxID=8319 RepID=A0AAV7TKZ7_PLEWA|nr:hypothetical protein NDU88_002213 [Pleurodeles waltl]